MSWLAGWDHRMAWTADSSDTAKVTATITKPSIPIFFGATVGIGDSYDNTPIFDEIGSNSDEMAITYGDTEELYVEVEAWNSVAETGVVWIGDNTDSSWTVVSGTDRAGWIYYKDGNANTDRVGIIGSANGEKVWDSDFGAVWHMKDGAITSGMYDSTSNDNDLTKYGANTPLESVSAEGYAQYFTVIDDWYGAASAADSTDFDFTGAFTISSRVNPDNVIQDVRLCNRYASGDGYYITQTASSAWSFVVFVSGSSSGVSSNSAPTGGLEHVVGVREADGTLLFYVDGAEQSGSGSKSGTINIGSAFWVGAGYTGYDRIFEGYMYEMRVSGVRRSAAWINADHHFQDDNLLYFGSEERLFIPQVIIF